MTEYSSGGVAETDVAEAAVDDDSTFTMQNWLDSSSDFKTLKRGEVVEGSIMAIQRDGVIVDVGSKSEGVIPPHEMHSLGADPLSKVAVGEKVLVYVMQPESDQGQVTLSIDRARGERGWRVLQTRFEEGEAFDGEVTGYNKGGLLVNVEGVHAFVPLSQVVGVRPAQEGEGGLGSAVGKQLRLKVIEINRRRNRVILSERAALQEWRSQQKDRLLAELKEGEIRKGRVSSVRSFGVFIDLGGADGLAHLSEVSWDRNKSPEEMYKVGDEVEVYVMKVDAETKKIALSLRRAQPEEWDLIVDKYQVGRVVPGMVTKLVTFGAFARIEGPVEGLIHVSELVDRRIAHPKEVVREGDLLPLKIVRIERDRHRLGLSLREARDEGLKMGFTFSDAGEVIQVPPEMKREFEEREGISVVERGPDDFSGPPVTTPKEETPAIASGAAAADVPAPAPAVAPAPRREPTPEPPSAMAQAFADAQAQLAKSDDSVADTPEAAATEDVAPAAEASAAIDEPITADAPADEDAAATADASVAIDAPVTADAAATEDVAPAAEASAAIDEPATADPPADDGSSTTASEIVPTEEATADAATTEDVAPAAEASAAIDEPATADAPADAGSSTTASEIVPTEEATTDAATTDETTDA